MKKLSLIVMMLITFSFAKAQQPMPGEFDYDFGEWGIVTEELNNLSVFLTGKSSLALQSDGKSVIFTEYSDGGPAEILLMRHNTDGSIDTSYGENGYVHLAPMSNKNYFSYDSKIVENDNMLLLAYTYGSDGGNMCLLKVDSNGNLITSFGNNGYVTFSKQANWTLVPRSLAIQNDGKIIVGGEYGEFDYGSCILRFTADGQLDTTFGNNGMVLHESFDSNGWQVMAVGESVSVGSDGRIYLCGWEVTPDEEWGSPYSSKIICVDQNGDFVTTFGNNGVWEYSFSEVIDFINACKVMDDGKLLIAGAAETYNEIQGQPIYSVYVARLNPDGTFDTTFGNNGFTMAQCIENSCNYCHEMAVADNGEIYLAGYVWQDLKDMLIGAFNADGTLNTNFGENGFDHITFGGNKTSTATDIAVQDDGKIVAIGHYEHEETFADYMLVRLHTAASLDAVEENTIANGIYTYPNPAVNEVRFVNLENECIANVYDAMGRLVMRETVSNESALNVSLLTSGNYFVELIDGSQIIKTRFVK